MTSHPSNETLLKQLIRAVEDHGCALGSEAQGIAKARVTELQAQVFDRMERQSVERREG